MIMLNYDINVFLDYSDDLDYLGIPHGYDKFEGAFKRAYGKPGTEILDLFIKKDKLSYTNEIGNPGAKGFIISGGKLIEYKGKESIITIPNKVVQIGPHFYHDYKTIIKINIPASVQKISSGAFQACCVSDYSVDENNQYFTTVDGVLFSKDMKILIAYPNGRKNQRYIVPDSVKEIGNAAFFSVIRINTLEEVVLPSGIKTIRGAAFADCQKLARINLPEGLSKIQYNAFSDTSLREIVIPYSMKTIDETAFSSCSLLRYATVPAHIANPEKLFPHCDITVV